MLFRSIGAQSRLTYLRPPVLIVGTHADKQSPRDIAKTKSEIRKRISGKEYGKHVVPPLFSIDNTSSLKIDNTSSLKIDNPRSLKIDNPSSLKIDNTSSLTRRLKRIKRVFRKGPKEQKHQTGINKYWLRFYDLDIMDISTHSDCASFLHTEFICHATYFKHVH